MKRRAMTIIEILVVLAIIALAVLPMIALHRGQTYQAAQAGTLLRAHSLLLELSVEATGRLHSGRFRGGAFSVGPLTKRYPWGKGEIEVEETVSVTPSSLTTGLWEVKASIGWKERRGNTEIEQRRRMITLVADPVPPRTVEAGGQP